MKNATEVEIASRNLVRAASKVDVGTHLSEQEVITDAFSYNEADTQEIERVKIGSNKICIREDQADEKIVFSKESSPSVFELDNVELIQLKKSSIQCTPCLHYISAGTLICKCGKLMKPDQDVMNRIKEAFEILKAPHNHTSPIVTRGRKCVRTRGSCIITRLDTHCEVLQKVKEHLLQSGTDGKIMRPTGNLSLPTIGRTHGSGTWTTSCISTSTTKQRNRRERFVNLFELRSVDENKQAPPPWQRPGYWEAKKELLNLQKSKREDKTSLYPS